VQPQAPAFHGMNPCKAPGCCILQVLPTIQYPHAYFKQPLAASGEPCLAWIIPAQQPTALD
jgi:hypothetical protein